MNKTSKDRIDQAFSLAYNTAMRFDAQVNAAFSRYKDAKEKAKSNAAEYKDETAAYAKAMEAPTAEARAALKEADKEFADTIKNTVIPRLREILADHVTATPPANFMNAIRIYREFGLKPSTMELKTLLHASEGNFMGMRALQTVARESGFDIRFDDVREYEKDIENLEKLARTPTCYAPLSYSKECDEVFPEVPVFGDDGGVAYYQQPSSIRAILTATEYSNGWKKIQEARERWGAAIVPEITTYKPKVDEETGETISPGEQRNADIDAAAKVADVNNDPALIGKKLGEMRANQAKESNRILSHYVNKPGASQAGQE